MISNSIFRVKQSPIRLNKTVSRLLLFIAAVSVLMPLFGESLIPCPDCSRQVSKRALMCPGCGCKGSVIEKAAKTLQSKPKPKPLDRWVKADFGKTAVRALPVQMDDGAFVVLPLENTFGLETLVFSYATTNTTIAYGVPEVALNRPIVRFPIAVTNLQFATVYTNVTSRLMEPADVKISDVSGWQAVQPKALKNHGNILLRIKAGEPVKLPPRAHPYYRLLESKWKMKGGTK